MDLGLEGKRALVMGASRGLGLGIAKALAAEGARVLLSGRSGERLSAHAAAITAVGGEAVHAVADLSAPEAAATLEQAVTEHLGGLDILINNTGGPPPGRMADADPAALAAHFEPMVLRVA
ncbi:MAG: SDR family NAD(P)-dependent oxidoreductase, partial [Pseudomonadota bacterium]